MNVPTSQPQRPPHAMAPNDCVVTYQGMDGISSSNWSPTANLLVSGNWDSSLSCWAIDQHINNGGDRVVAAVPKVQSKYSFGFLS